MKSFILMVTFFTRIPLKCEDDFNQGDFVRGIYLVPLVGLLIGLILYAFSYLRLLLDKEMAGLILWAVYIWLTGGLHMDGLADSIDGLSSGRTRERVLEIMKDSRLGTFGALGVFFILSFNIGLTCYLEPKIFILAPVVGRSCGVISASISTYARPEGGMGKIFIEESVSDMAGIALIFTSLLGILINSQWLMAIVGAMIMTFFITRRIEKSLGGMTGDTIGLIIEVSQTIFLFITYLLGKIIP